MVKYQIKLSVVLSSTKIKADVGKAASAANRKWTGGREEMIRQHIHYPAAKSYLVFFGCS